MVVMTLRGARLARELSQEKMAEMLGIHINTYRKWEINPSNISISNAFRICEILKVPFDGIIFLPDDSTNM